MTSIFFIMLANWSGPCLLVRALLKGCGAAVRAGWELADSVRMERERDAFGGIADNCGKHMRLDSPADKTAHEIFDYAVHQSLPINVISAHSSQFVREQRVRVFRSYG
jgi:hypothetical protein